VSATKKSHGKSKPKGAPVQMEYAGDMLQRNIWFKIGLPNGEASMLKTIGARIFIKPASSACVARTFNRGLIIFVWVAPAQLRRENRLLKVPRSTLFDLR